MTRTDTKSTDQLVDEFLATAGVTFHVQLVGATTRDDWECDEWRVRMIAGRCDYSTTYYTGTGHRAMPKWNAGLHGRKPTPGTLAHEDWMRGGRPVKPSAASVLHSLVLDGTAIDQSFADWCADFGYEEDSRKALQTYTDCCESGRKLRQLFNPSQRQALADMLQDY